MLSQLLALFVSLLALAPGLDEKALAAAQQKFVRAAAAGTLEERKTALAALVALGEPGAVPTLTGEYGTAAEALRAARGEALRLRYACERREVVLSNLRTQAERDPTLAEMLKREEEKFSTLKKDRSKAEARVAELEPWRDAVADGLGTLFQALGPARRRKSDAEVWQDARQHPDTLLRAASVELVGRIGGPGTAAEIHDLMVEASVGIDKLRARIAKSMGDVRKMEQRMQEEANRSGGVLQATAQQYDQARREASELTSQGYRLEILVEAAQRAGALALSREGGKELEKAMARLVGTLKKAKDRTRVDTLRMLALCKGDDVREPLRNLLAAETEPLAIGTLIDGLAALGDATIEPALLTRHLGHEAWYVRACAARALATLRSRAGISALIAKLEKEEGRTRTDMNTALQSLTGQTFRPVHAVWQRWWKENEKDFVVPPVPPERTLLEEAQEASGVTFFGISTDSQRVLFVLDLSGSMKFAMAPRQNPNDDPGMPYDEPRQGELSRLEVAKRDLAKAVSGLKDGGVFNIVLFASDVWTWSDDLETMKPEVRAEVNEFIAGTDAVGGTNIHGALERALDLAGARSGAGWSQPVIDTIYFLTDGRATVGVTTDPEEILAYVRERNRNAGIVIHTIGLSDAHDAVLMRRLAEENGGIYVGR